MVVMFFKISWRHVERGLLRVHEEDDGDVL